MSRLSKVLFAGGGTGGHVYMGLALASELRTRDPQTAVLFVGTRKGLENRILPEAGFPLETIEVGGLNRVSVSQLLKSLAQIPRSLLRSRAIVRHFSPSVVVGVGGYASGPVVLAGKLSGFPCLLIEPNVYPGLANRWLGRWVDRAVVAWQETARWFGAKARLTGIPIRREFFGVRSEVATEGPLRVLIFGGSQGSRAVNTLVCEALDLLPADRVTIVHQTGPADLERVRNCYDERPLQAEVLAFIDDMPRRFEAADLVISRAGASTVAEIAAAGRPSLLIPLPSAADDHQRRNAEAMASRGAAVVLEQDAAAGRDLARAILELEADRPRLQRMSEASRRMARPDSTDAIIRLMEEIAV